jgi:hypothetical protein
MSKENERKGFLVEILKKKGSKGLSKKEIKKDNKFGIPRAKKNLKKNFERFLGRRKK